ncbi:MAG: ion channel [Nocardioidaceae bacterium]
MKVPRLSRKWLKPGLIVSSAVLVLGAGAAAAFESDTVGSFWRGLWWALSLMTTVGYVGGPPKTSQGAVISVVLMLTGFLLLSLVSAALASLFVREDEEPIERRELATERQLLETLGVILERLESLEAAVGTTRPDPRQDETSRPPEP